MPCFRGIAGAVRKTCRTALAAFLSAALLLSSAPGEEIPRFGTFSGAMEYLSRCEAECRTEVLFLIPTAELLKERPVQDDRGQPGFDLDDSLWNLIYALPSVFTLSYGTAENGEDTCVRLGLRYRDGVRLYRAWRQGEADTLDEAERQALRAACGLAEEAAQREGDLEKARALCVLLCERIRFSLPGETALNVKGCLAALNEGAANCQGYSDAFYLAASILGLDVGYLNGRAVGTGENHTWNTLTVDGQVLYVDLTWMDRPSGTDFSQFAMTPEILLRTHAPYPPLPSALLDPLSRSSPARASGRA